MNINGIKIDNIENINNTRAILNLNINLLLANHKKYKAHYDNKIITFLNKKTSEKILEVSIEDLSADELEALDVAFNNKVKECKYEIKFTCKPGEYVYVLLPEISGEKEDQRFTFKAMDIQYVKVERLYGNDKVYAISDLIETKDTHKRFLGIPNVFCFKNIYDAITACKITPDDGYGSISEYVDNCEKYIKYHYYADTGYDYKSVIPYDFLVDYDINGSTLTYGLWYDTDENHAWTYTLPIAFNEANGKIIKDIKECRADSLGSEGINISLNNEQIKIKRIKVDVSFSIDKIENKNNYI